MLGAWHPHSSQPGRGAGADRLKGLQHGLLPPVALFNDRESHPRGLQITKVLTIAGFSLQQHCHTWSGFGRSCRTLSRNACARVRKLPPQKKWQG